MPDRITLGYWSKVKNGRTWTFKIRFALPVNDKHIDIFHFASELGLTKHVLGSWKLTKRELKPEEVGPVEFKRLDLTDIADFYRNPSGVIQPGVAYELPIDQFAGFASTALRVPRSHDDVIDTLLGAVIRGESLESLPAFVAPSRPRVGITIESTPQPGIFTFQ